MSTVDDSIDERIEAALAALAADVSGTDDLAVVRRRVAERAAAATRPPVGNGGVGGGHRWWLAAAAALVVLAGVVGIVRLQADSPDDPVSPPPTSPAPPAPAGPIVPEQVAVLGPDAGMGSPSRSNPYMDWVSERPEDPYLVYTRPDGSDTISYTYGSDFGGSDDAQEIVDLGDDIIGRRGTLPDDAGQFLTWSSGDVVHMVSWTSGVSESEALDFVRSAIEDPDAPVPPDGMVAPSYPQPVDTALVTYRGGDITVGFARYRDGQRPAADELAGAPDDDPPASGQVVVTPTEFGEIATVELGTDVLAWVASANDDVDAATLVEHVELVPYAGVPYSDELSDHPMPTDADVAFGGDQPPTRWVRATWTADDGQRCVALMAGMNGNRRCGSGSPPSCLAMMGGTANGETRYFVLAEGSPTRIAATFNDPNGDDYYDGSEFTPELIAADAGYTFASGALDDSVTVAGVTVDGEDCTLL